MRHVLHYRSLAVISALALSLTACNTITPPTPTAPVVQVSADISFRIRQGKTALHVAQTALLHQRDAADRQNLLGSYRAQVFALTNRSGPLNQAVNAVDAAADTLDPRTFDEQVARAYALIAQVSRLLPAGK